MKIVVINSAGPMGSTVLGALIEKLGYLNLPVRKRDLHGYLLKKRLLSDDYFKERTLEILGSMSVKRIGGGTGVLDRNSAAPVQRSDQDRILSFLSEYKGAQFATISDMYAASNDLIAKSVIYKNIGPYVGHIEFPTDIERYRDSVEDLYDAYAQEFDEVIFFHMQRDIVGWINSLMSQLLFARHFRGEQLKVRLSSLVKRYETYRYVVNNIPGHHIDFEELFEPNTHKLVAKLVNILGGEFPKDLKAESFDLYGRVVSYDKAFNKEDDRHSYISDLSKRLVVDAAHGKGNSICKDVVFLLSHLLRTLRVRCGTNVTGI